MVSDNRLRMIGLAMVVAGLLLAAGTGCSALRTPLADRGVVLPPGVELPDGFYPLAYHYEPGNPDDDYDGWPRYIVCERDNMVMA